MKAESASITASFSSSVPTVMRSASGKPYSSTRLQDDAALMEELVGGARRLAVTFREMHQQEVGGARRDAQADALKRLGHAAAPDRVVLDRLLHMRLVVKRGDAGGDDGPVTLNGPLMRFSASAIGAGQ